MHHLRSEIATVDLLPAPEDEGPPESLFDAMNRTIRDTARGADDFQQATLDALQALIAVVDENGLILSVNAAWDAAAAEADDDARLGVGMNYLTVCDRAARSADARGAADVAAGVRAVLGGERDDFVVEYPCHGPSHERWYVLRVVRLLRYGAVHAVLHHQDVTTRHQAEAELRFRAGMLDLVDAAVIAVAPDGTVLTWSDGAEALYGWTGAEAAGRGVSFVLPDRTAADAVAAMEEMQGSGRWTGELELQRRDGSRFLADIRTLALHDADGGPTGFVSVSVDVSERDRAARGLRAAHDHMRAVAESMGDGLCTMDQDGRITYVNRRAQELLGWTSAELVGQDLGEVLHRTTADGATWCDDDALVRRDGTLLPVKQVTTPIETTDGAGGFVLVFSDNTEVERKLQDLEWVRRVHAALEQDLLVVHAQPIVELAHGRVVGHELLVRMSSEDGSLVPPGDFLPIAEAYGLMDRIDRWVVLQGIALAAAGRAVEINVSAQSLSDRTFCDFVSAELQRTGADATLVGFELTETAIMRDEAAALRFTTAMRERGCRLALDDFGTGYGGFSYLRRFVVDALKIDREFVRDLTRDGPSRKVVEAVVRLARGFAISTVAEGVEDEETLALLRDLGVDRAQGYLTGRPAPLEAMVN